MRPSTLSGLLHAPLLALLILIVSPGIARADEPHKILIADPFIELHTGPGRGYPVFYVIERGREVTIVKRRTDWFQLRTDRGLEGWADLSFLVAPSGDVIDPRVEDSSRRQLFGRPALAAVRKWRYEPPSAGHPSLTERTKVRIEFRLER